MADENGSNAATKDAWAQLYEAPTAMATDWGHHRIYAPVAYKTVRASAIIPIVHTEVLSLASFFPICWALVANEPILCALRTLLMDGSGIPIGSKAGTAALPSALRAYPIIVPYSDEFKTRCIFVDRAIADEPTDIGAPLMMADGQLARATTMRAQIAAQTGRALPTTRALSRSLYEQGLLEHWPLRFDVGGGESVDINHLMVISRSCLENPGLYNVIHSFGVDAALCVSAHRLSLFRTTTLLSAARSAVAAKMRKSLKLAVP